MIQKISVIILAISVAFSSCAQQTTPTGVPMKKITKKGTTIAHDTSTTPATTTDKSSKTGTSSTTPGTQTTLSTNEQIANGLKEALKIGATNSANKLSITDAFFKNNIIKILMPPEVKDVESKMRALGFGSMVDDAILRMN
ncbi:MAG: DUF4197 domain-containing protein, partial [Chitinophagales bacterium]|nr:DUF4197 domain-containing protein [Chitinophagales bacterium]